MRGFAPRRREMLVAAATGLAGLTGCNQSPVTLGTASCPAVCLHGTFYQPLLAHLERSEEQWRTWMAGMAALGVKRLVLQHVALEPYDVLVPAPGAGWRANPGGAALGRILDAALPHAIRVWIGLSYDPRYWSTIDTKEIEPVAAYLDARSRRLRGIANGLRPATAHASAAGWYISDEIDDLNWAQPERARLLERWLAEQTQMLRQAAPTLQIAISGFVHSETTAPKTWADQWRRWLDAAPYINEVLLQDGIGAAKTTLGSWPACLAAVCAAARERGRRCTPVVELFEGDAATGAALTPAAVARVARQMHIAQSASNEVVAFSVPEFVTGAHPQARQLQTYFLDACRLKARGC